MPKNFSTQTTIHRLARRFAIPACFGLAAVMSTPAFADYGLESAHEDGTQPFQAALVRAIAENPLEIDSILQEAVAVAPGEEELIRSTTVEYFPGFQDKVSVLVPPAPVPSAEPAAETTAPDGAAPQTLTGLTQGWTGEVSLGGQASTGNTKTEGIGFSAALTQQWGKWQNQANATFDFSRDDGEVTQRRWDLNGETQRDFTDRIFGYGFLGYSDDTFSGYDYRFTESAGMGYRLIKRDDMGLTIQAGPGFRQTQPVTGDFDNTWIIRGASDYFWQIAEGTRLTNSLSSSYAPDNTITENTLALTTTVVGNIGARFSVNVRYETDPSDDAERLDTLSKVSLVYTLD